MGDQKECLSSRLLPLAPCQASAHFCTPDHRQSSKPRETYTLLSYVFLKMEWISMELHGLSCLLIGQCEKCCGTAWHCCSPTCLFTPHTQLLWIPRAGCQCTTSPSTVPSRCSIGMTAEDLSERDVSVPMPIFVSWSMQVRTHCTKTRPAIYCCSCAIHNFVSSQ